MTHPPKERHTGRPFTEKMSEIMVEQELEDKPAQVAELLWTEENPRITGKFAEKDLSRNFSRLRKEGKGCKEKKREKIGEKQGIQTRKKKPLKKAQPRVKTKEEQGQHR